MTEHTIAGAHEISYQVPGSEVDSGFADDGADGYRLSFDEAMKASIDPVSILTWIGDLPSSESASGLEWECLYDAIALQDCDVYSVDICDSRSLVAEGPERGRIDRWRRDIGKIRGRE